MKVLIACEFSGIVRDAFRKRGHDAWSCDILDSEDPTYHLKQDVLTILDRDWDLVIAHPPCTHLSSSGARWFKDKVEEQLESIDFFLKFTKLNCKWCIENPVGVMSTKFRKPDQIIQPYQYGHPETKRTCLWLNKLPLLQETNNVYEYMMTLPKKQRNRTHYMSPGKDRGKLRSIFFKGIADAMAEQWGQL